MTSDSFNDNAPMAVPELGSHKPDQYGQSALLLVESLIHALVSRSIISLEDAVEIAATAVEVHAEIAISEGQTPSEVRKSGRLLEAIATSLRLDLPRE